MAQYLVELLGDALVTQPLKSHPCEESRPLPSPNDLKRRILIKNKKLHETSPTKLAQTNEPSIFRKTDSIATVTSEVNLLTGTTSTSPSQTSYAPSLSDTNRRRPIALNEIREDNHVGEFDTGCTSDALRNENPNESDDRSSDDDDISTMPINDTEVLTADPLISPSASNPEFPTNSDLMVESKATKAMSDLVHYVVPVRFVTFARSEERNRSYEISSFSEDKAQNLIRDQAREFVAYNQRQLSRIYPRGTRFDSSNYNPYSFWPVGCQMVALNYQTLGSLML